ncbi:MAG: hypothetical protein WB762_23970 [Candidatus Sulfotelmatobacter sp.]
MIDPVSADMTMIGADHRNLVPAGGITARPMQAKTREAKYMQTFQTDYLSAYHNLKLTRDDKGVLIAEFHSNGGPFVMSAQAHTEFVDAFYRIAQDRANKIVILTGAGGELLLMSSGPLSATSPIPGFGARFTTKAFRF